MENIYKYITHTGNIAHILSTISIPFFSCHKPTTVSIVFSTAPDHQHSFLPSMTFISWFILSCTSWLFVRKIKVIIVKKELATFEKNEASWS